MFRIFSILLCAVIIVVAVSAPRAEAMTMSEALVRMDALVAEMNALRAEFASLTSSVGQTTTAAPAVLGAQSADVFTESLEYGETNNDIRKIQTLLATDPEIYPYGVSSGFFGPKTQEGIRNFQARFGLDTVGIIGPATKALLSLFVAAYSDGNYPADVLKKKPQVLGVTTSNTATQTVSTPSVVSNSPVDLINAELDRGEAAVVIYYTNGNKRKLSVSADSESEVVKAIASRTTLSEAQIRAVIKFEDDDDDISSDADEDDALDALDDAEDAIDDADDAISEADDDGDDVDWAEDTLEEAEDLFDEAEDAFDDEDFEEAIDLANEAEDLAKDAEDRIGEEEDGEKGDSDDIDSIEAEVDEDESEITVKYDDGSRYVFVVEEDKDDEIIEEVADELDMDEDDVEDLIEFDYGDIDSIDVLVDEDEDEASVTVEFESGVKMRFTVNSSDEDDIIEEIADRLDERENDIEDIADFDY